jgi:ABC-type branched-subunit amino acid transport system ATPase component
METGRIVLQVAGAELLDNPMVREAYLGHEAGDLG